MYINISMNVWLSTESNTLQIHLKIHLWSMQNQHSHHNVAKFLAEFLHLQPYHYNLKSHLILLQCHWIPPKEFSISISESNLFGICFAVQEKAIVQNPCVCNVLFRVRGYRLLLELQALLVPCLSLSVYAEKIPLDKICAKNRSRDSQGTCS
jgi:hypothetical protein